MNTFKEYENLSSKAAFLLFLSIVLLFVGSCLPIINLVTPRLNSDLMAFFGLGLFGMVTCFFLPREATRFSLTSLGMLCGGWFMLACVQYIAGINTTYFSYFLVSTSYLVAVVLLSAWVKMWVQAGQGRLLADIGLGEVLASFGLIYGQLLEDSRKAVEASGNHRIRILSDAWLLIQQHPWMGVGWRQLQVTQVLTPDINEPVDHAHNLVAQIQVELGILGSLSLLGFAAYWLFKKKPWLQANGAELAMVCVVMVLGLHSLLEYPLWHAVFLFLFVIALSLLPEETYPVRLPLWLVKGVGMLLLFCTAWFYIDHSKAISAYERFNQNQSSEELIAANKTVWWNRLLFESIFMVNTPVTDDTRPVLRSIAKENANVFSQTIFINLPLLKVKIQDGETEVANQLGKRICLNVSDENWTAVQIHLRSLQDPRFNTWLDQLPPDTLNCKT